MAFLAAAASSRRTMFRTAVTRWMPSRVVSTSSSHPRRPFTILGVQQIAIGSATREPLESLWQGIFGLQPSQSVTLKSENVQEDILQVGPKPFQVEIDLMTPIDVNKSPKV
jgi:lactoylglutathione lyase